MMTQGEHQQLKLHSITIEELEPEDFLFIYDEVRELYSQNNGRPAFDPVILIKYLLVDTSTELNWSGELSRKYR